MNGNHFSLILLSTNQCNAACDYCFEDKTGERLSLERLKLIVDKVIDHLAAQLAILRIRVLRHGDEKAGAVVGQTGR